MSGSKIKIPSKGEKISYKNGKLSVPENPIIPFIEGDGIGVDITPVMIDVVDAAIASAYGGKKEKLAGWKYIAVKNQLMFMVQMNGCLKKHCKPAGIMWFRLKVH